MSIMSLFNTMARKREKNFHAICQTFEREGVTTLEQAEECRAVMLSNAKTYVAFVVLLGLSLAMIFQAVAGIILVAMLALVLYIIATTLRGRELVKRFIEEVLPTLDSSDDSEPLNSDDKNDN